MPVSAVDDQANQRARPRRAGKQLLLCGVRGEQRRERWAARIHNVSATGIGLLLPGTVERGTILTLRFWGPAGMAVRRRHACVMHVTPQQAGLFVVGCALDSELSARELKALV